MYIQFADKLRWTPQQVDAQDIAFIQELAAFWRAQSRHEAQQAQQRKLQDG